MIGVVAAILALAFASSALGGEVAVPQGGGKLPTIALVECLADDGTQAAGQYCRTTYDCGGEQGVLWEGLLNHNGRRVTLESDLIAYGRDCVLDIEDDATVQFFTGYRPEGRFGEVVAMVRSGGAESTNRDVTWARAGRSTCAAAKERALEICNDRHSDDGPCSIPRDSGGWEAVHLVRDGPCLAIAESGDGVHYFQFAANATDAERWAIARCRTFGGTDCRLGAIRERNQDGSYTSLGRVANCYSSGTYCSAFAWQQGEVYPRSTGQAPSATQFGDADIGPAVDPSDASSP